MPKMRTARAFSAGGLVFRRRRGSIEVALVGKGEPRLWALPKGLPNQRESAEEAALREVEEETGLAVRLLAPIDDIEYWFVADGRRIHKTVRYFLMECVGGSETRHDWEYDEVAWFPAEEAARCMAYANERRVLEQALALLSLPGPAGGPEAAPR